MVKINDNSSTIKDILICCEVLEEKKAEQLCVLSLGEKSSLTDYFIIATGSSSPHLKALSKAIESTLRENKLSVVGIDMNPESGWIVVDAFDFMIHIFTKEMRDHYQLEFIWKDAEPLCINR